MTCSVEGCSVKSYARGWCKRHYYRAHRNDGNPLAFKVVQKYDRYDEHGNKWCTRHGAFVPVVDFGKSAKTWCTICKRASRYGLTRDEFLVLPGTGGDCPLCLKRPADVVDHDHACCPGREACGNCIRGLICRQCNAALGVLTEEGVVRAMEYLK